MRLIVLLKWLFSGFLNEGSEKVEVVKDVEVDPVIFLISQRFSHVLESYVRVVLSTNVIGQPVNGFFVWCSSFRHWVSIFLVRRLGWILLSYSSKRKYKKLS